VAEIRISRRRVIKRIEAGAAVAWTAPVLPEIPAVLLRICPRGPLGSRDHFFPVSERGEQEEEGPG
jgi:hypothetical protein